ncbi:hypothetical protein F5Y18DRAFT_353272 [Xylariaceae sp. FL1019]|nr:hypothetical protein F5Y18DRAFT_353272 [Xylariaceae sp. FL1019]
MTVSFANVDVLAAPTARSAGLLDSSQPSAAVVPLLSRALHCGGSIGRILWPLILQICFVATAGLYLGKLATIRSLKTTTGVLFSLIQASTSTTRMLWNTRAIRRLRKKFEFEFFVLILGGGGNNLFLVIFWPGWIILGCLAFAISVFLG